MKSTALALFGAVLSSMSLTAMEGVELELMGPKEPLVLTKAQIEEIANSAEAKKAYEAELRDRKLDAQSFKRLEKMAMAANRAQQGIELTYRITNKTDAAIILDHGGDATTNQLELRGPGALNFGYRGMMTREFRIGKPFTLEPGKSKEFTIKELKYGARDMSRWVITQAGDYEVALTHKTNVGGKRTELKSNTVKFSVAVK